MDASTDPRLPLERCNTALDHLMTTVPGLTGAVLSRSDGFEVASRTRGDVPVSRLSALSSSMVALSQAALRELGMNGGGSVLVEGQDGKLLLLEVPLYGHPMVLAAVGKADLVTGTLLWAARDCVRQLITNP
ncbi:MAG TPA: roadblock/LC7 domain-containing protein [Solimonas sp.]|nr:roadblock/LC7 domain-containing protein [Solimonas sp.]